MTLLQSLIGSTNDVYRLDVSKESSAHIETPEVDAIVKEATAALNKQMVTRPQTPAQQISGSFRAQSASLNRPRTTPARPIKSAGSRSRATQATSTVSIGVAEKSSKNYQPTKKGNTRSIKTAVNANKLLILNIFKIIVAQIKAVFEMTALTEFFVFKYNNYQNNTIINIITLLLLLLHERIDKRVLKSI